MRLIVSAVPGLRGEHREEMRRAAAECGFDIAFFEGDAEALPAAEEAEVIFAQSPRLPAVASKLKWMCTPFAGVDGFLREAEFAAPDALLTCSAGAYGVTISEHVVMVTLMLMRQAAAYGETVRRRGWTRNLPIQSIHFSRVTALGTGDIGTACARRLRGFEPAVIRGVSRRGLPNEAFDTVDTVACLEALLPETDLLVMALPGTRATAGLMNEARLALLPENALLVNVGRGSAVDEQALAERLRSGRLAGAALDVFTTEPLPPDSPLWDVPGLLITPHIAGNMTLPYTVDRIVRLFTDNLRRFAAGEPLKALVDRERGY